MNTIIKKEKINTCNSWGFGGYIATETTYDNGYRIIKGKIYYRHHFPQSFIRYFNSQNNQITKEQFLENTVISGK